MPPLGPSSLLAIAALFAAGCTQLKPNGYALQADASQTDAARTDAADAGCGHAQPPPPPAVPTDVEGSLELILATRSVDFGDAPDPASGKPRWQALGYDLDATCTGYGEGDSCVEPWWANGPHADGTQGRDNAIGAAALQLPFPGTFTTFFGGHRGEQSTIFRITDYDGSDNDTHVDVDAYSGTLWSSPGDPTAPVPLGNAEDMWKLGDDWLEAPELLGTPNDSGRSKFRDDKAYVANGVLVAHFKSMLMGEPFLPAPACHDVVVTGKLTRGDAGWSLHAGVFAGKWLMSDLVQLMAFYIDTATAEGPLCAGSPSFNGLKALFCRYVDIRVEEAGDGPLYCDGMSMAFSFEAVPASIGGHVGRQRDMPTCPPGSDPVSHSCGVDD